MSEVKDKSCNSLMLKKKNNKGNVIGNDLSMSISINGKAFQV